MTKVSRWIAAIAVLGINGILPTIGMSGGYRDFDWDSSRRQLGSDVGLNSELMETLSKDFERFRKEGRDKFRDAVNKFKGENIFETGHEDDNELFQPLFSLTPYANYAQTADKLRNGLDYKAVIDRLEKAQCGDYVYLVYSNKAVLFWLREPVVGREGHGPQHIHTEHFYNTDIASVRQVVQKSHGAEKDLTSKDLPSDGWLDVVEQDGKDISPCGSPTS